MNWYYVDAGKQAGPVSDDQIEELRRSGKINEDTLVWREGMAEWLPYRQARPSGTGATATTSPPVFSSGTVCAECGRSFDPNDMIQHGNAYICAACKPIFMQKLAEGVPGTGTFYPAGSVTVDELLSRDYQHDIGEYISKGWEIFKQNAGILIGASILVFLCILVANMIPYASSILSIIFTGPLMGGLWVLYLKILRGKEARVGDAFSGFGPRFGHLILGNFIPGIISFLCLVPMFVVLIGFIGLTSNYQSGGLSHSGEVSGLAVALTVLFGIAGMCGLIYLSVCWFFTLPLIIDKNMGFWPAMNVSRKVVTKHWWMTLLVTMVIGIIATLGFIACGVGILVSGPVSFMAASCAYERLFGDLAVQS